MIKNTRPQPFDTYTSKGLSKPNYQPVKLLRVSKAFITRDILHASLSDILGLIEKGPTDRINKTNIIEKDNQAPSDAWYMKDTDIRESRLWTFEK
ncbi:hypothetical protein LTR66_014343 [Elasticomyces elasticus]|nr:hypothetical protein LTR66_014343 [Elasticomyces elasticus]